MGVLFNFFDMKRTKKNCIDGSGVFMVVFAVMCFLFGVVDGGLLAANASVTPSHGGAIGIDEPTSVTRTNEDSVNLLLDEIDPRVTKIRPHEVVLDTISRHGDTRNSDSQVVRHYAVDVLDLNALVTTAIVAGNAQEELITSDDAIFAVDQTVLCDGIPGYLDDGVTVDVENDLMLYIVGVSNNNHPLAIPVNGAKATATSPMTFPAIPVNTVLIRAGRAGAESQIATDPYSGIPTDFPQFLQKFMTQIEMTTLFRIRDKEVKWDFSDKEEEALFDMKRTMNITFWRGVKKMLKVRVRNTHNNKVEEVYFTGGVWNQAGKEFSFGGSAITHNNIISMMKTAFVGNASSKTKLFIMGSDLLEKFEQVDYIKHMLAGARKQAYGLEFSEIVSHFGRLMVIHDQTLNDLGWSDRGFILDVDFLRKWTMGWRVEEFDLKKSMQSDSEARMLMEICGLVLRNPEAHMRVLFN